MTPREALQILVEQLGDRAEATELSLHGCRWEICYSFACCGLVVEIQPLNC